MLGLGTREKTRIIIRVLFLGEVVTAEQNRHEQHELWRLPGSGM
jgi:hypothetical protein